MSLSSILASYSARTGRPLGLAEMLEEAGLAPSGTPSLPLRSPEPPEPDTPATDPERSLLLRLQDVLEPGGFREGGPGLLGALLARYLPGFGANPSLGGPGVKTSRQFNPTQPSVGPGF